MASSCRRCPDDLLASLPVKHDSRLARVSLRLFHGAQFSPDGLVADPDCFCDLSPSFAGRAEFSRLGGVPDGLLPAPGLEVLTCHVVGTLGTTSVRDTVQVLGFPLGPGW